MQSPFTPVQKNRYWTFLSLASLALMVIGGLVTAKYGAGVASDSVKYLAVAQSLLDGHGLFDHRGLPLLSWPPLYPILIAALSWLTRLDVFDVAGYLNILVLGLNLFLSGVILQRVFSAKMIYAYLGVLFIFLSNPNLRIHSVISSDPLYLTMAFVLVLVLDVYLRKHSTGSLILILLLSALTPLLRYVGLAIGATAGLIILIEHWRSVRIWLRDGVAVALASFLPIGWWLLVHNLGTYGSLWGLQTQIVDVGMNFSLGLTKILHWFIPYLSFLMPIFTRPWIPLVALIVLLVVLNWKRTENVRSWSSALRARTAYPVLIHALVYFVAVSLTAVTADHRDLYSDRYYFLMLVPVLIVAFVTFDALILPHLRLSPKQWTYALIVLFALWSIYPLYTMQEYLREARTEGEPSSVNLFNNRTYNEMDLVAEMKELREREPGAILYSNYVDAVWFHTRQPVMLLPFVRDLPEDGMLEWPGDKPGYIIWFEPNEYKHYVSPEMIGKFANIKVYYEGKGGRIYYVQGR
jgi:hypothetical protein